MTRPKKTDAGNDPERLFEWAQERPGWQQEALRRLSVQEVFSNQDLEEITELCRLSRGLAPKLREAPKTRPLRTKHFGDLRKLAEGMFLRKLHNLKAVSALPNGASLQFVEGSTPPDPCLAVVYGGNASGKSSYARILKACGRGRATVQTLAPDYRRGTNAIPSLAEATLDFSIAGTDGSAKWVEGEETDERLRAVAFFDAECAEVQIARPNTLNYLPGGLHLLKALGDVSTQVQERLRAELDGVESARPASITSPTLKEGTKAYCALNSAESFEDLERLRSLSRLSPTEGSILRDLRVTFADEDRAKKSAVDACTRVAELYTELEDLASAVSDERAEAVKQSLADYRAADEALKSLASGVFSEAPIQGVGTPAWRTLWNAAKRFSERHAYPGREFPATDAGDQCVLCQQELLPDAQKRFREFAEFLEREAEERFAAASSAVKDQEDSLRSLNHDADFILKDGLFSDLEEVAPDAIEPYKVYWTSALKRIRCLLCSLESLRWEELSALPASPSQRVQEVCQQFARKARDLGDEEIREKLRHQLAELQDRAELRRLLPDVKTDLSLRREREGLKHCLRDAGTDQISREIKRLGKTFFTEKLRRDFASELKELWFSTAQVEIATHGSYGALQFEIRLVGAPHGTKVPAILSEGEKRCVALAGFLAELRGDLTVSVLVFDDPVSSLDHNWRERIAVRLVDEARHRQVIIFTHDVVFLSRLNELAQEKGVPCYPTQIERLGARVGTCRKGTPWLAMAVAGRLSLLKKTTLREARRLHDEEEGSHSEYVEKVGYFYKRLRESWERAVEELLFQQTVMRLRRSVEPNRLRKLREIHEQDIKTIDEAMGRCSIHLHDGVPQESLPLPAPDELERDLEVLRIWVEQHQGRPRVVKA